MARSRGERTGEERLSPLVVKPAKANKKETTGSEVPKVGSPRWMSS